MVFEHLEEKEAVEIAALIEKNGFAFYSILADKTKKKSIKAVFKKLAKDERRHMKILEDKYYPEAGFGEQITEEELKQLLETKTNPIAYDGFEPSGELHIAQG
ncbi:MAG: hypothetical protein UT63_C0102G0004, partial [Candidatus Gottesmanbacteria bacterium GW2011_GWC2_39_8]